MAISKKLIRIWEGPARGNLEIRTSRKRAADRRGADEEFLRSEGAADYLGVVPMMGVDTLAVT